MDLKTFLTVRNLYYTGLVALMVNAIPQLRKYVVLLFDKEVAMGFTFISIMTVFVAIGAWQAYKRKL